MESKQVKVLLTYLKDENKIKIDFEGTSLQGLTIDLSNITGGEARALIAASATECMSSWILHFLKRHEEDLSEFQAVATVDTVSDEAGNRVGKITVEMRIGIAGDESKRQQYEKIVKRILDKGCLISRSLESGVDVEYIPIIKSSDEKS